MERDEVLRLMGECGAAPTDPRPSTYGGVVDVFERFAVLVAAAKREACAKACESLHEQWRRGLDDPVSGPSECAAAIRARK